MLDVMESTGVIDVAESAPPLPRGRGFEAVRGVSFSVRRGELFALLGTNGAGKTSLLEVVEGLAARVVWEGAGAGPRPAPGAPGGAAADRDRVAGQWVSCRNLTVTETARMWAGTLTAPRPVGEALDMVDLGHRARVGVRQLSGGERRRLDLALALLGRPEVLFLDEPTSGLDPECRQGVWRLIRDLLDDGHHGAAHHAPPG